MVLILVVRAKKALQKHTQRQNTRVVKDVRGHERVRAGFNRKREFEYIILGFLLNLIKLALTHLNNVRLKTPVIVQFLLNLDFCFDILKKHHDDPYLHIDVRVLKSLR